MPIVLNSFFVTFVSSINMILSSILICIYFISNIIVIKLSSLSLKRYLLYTIYPKTLFTATKSLKNKF